MSRICWSIAFFFFVRTDVNDTEGSYDLVQHCS
jgi:hypothetical protein